MFYKTFAISKGFIRYDSPKVHDKALNRWLNIADKLN